MKAKRPYPVTWLLVLVFCASTSYSGPELVTDFPSVQKKTIPILQSWHGDFPVSQLKLLPEGQQQLSLGYIDGRNTFSAVWQAFNPAEKTPEIDFTRNIVIFLRNTHFYNRISISNVALLNGTAEILAMETMSAIPIDDKVAMSFAVISSQGIKNIQAGNERIHLP